MGRQHTGDLAAIAAPVRSPPMVVHSRDLARTSVFLDFDGTIAPDDVGVHLLERLGDPAWRDVEEQFLRGEIGSRETMVAEWGMLPTTDEQRLRRVAGEIGVDPAFETLVAGLRQRDAEVTVVSDGFGFYVQDAVESVGIDVITNAVDFDTGRLEFPNEDRCCPCTTCGTCKQAPIRDAQARGRITVLVGDGASDHKAALIADHVFAKDALARWCADADIPHIRVEDLGDVRFELLGV